MSYSSTNIFSVLLGYLRTYRTSKTSTCPHPGYRTVSVSYFSLGKPHYLSLGPKLFSASFSSWVAKPWFTILSHETVKPCVWYLRSPVPQRRQVCYYCLLSDPGPVSPVALARFIIAFSSWFLAHWYVHFAFDHSNSLFIFYILVLLFFCSWGYEWSQNKTLKMSSQISTFTFIG